MNLYRFCEKLSALMDLSDDFSENTNGLRLLGSSSQESVTALNELKDYIGENHLQKSIILTVDTVPESWDDFSVSSDDEFDDWSVSILSKSQILEATGITSPDIDVYLFLSLEYFRDKWLDACDLNNPLSTDSSTEHYFSDNKGKKIIVHGLPNDFGGPKMAVISTMNWCSELHENWLSSTRLPEVSRVKKAVHFISRDSFFSSEKFLLNWGDVDCDIAIRFHRAQAVILFSSLVQEYYSIGKVILGGKKRLELELSDGTESISSSFVQQLRDTIEWAYAEKDESTRLVLIAERLSLDLSNDKTLLSCNIFNLKSAFAEAKSRYKYVILERKSDYAKELSDLKKNASAVVDKYVSTSSDVISFLLKDVLAFGFMLTVGVIAKKIAYDGLITSSSSVLLFKAFSFYLIIAGLLRITHSYISVGQSERICLSWSDVMREYMSKREFEEVVDTHLFPTKATFIATLIVVSFCYMLFALSAWNMLFVLSLLGVS